ncbi:DUF5993 family protein [Amycolatopsis halotolerans]|uniref:DUF5993 family protein n=1 Tax=Amycolatopsis halotolerans TaxID=330083 RepID=A0ABV7Q8G2_9PSEU
MDTIIMVGIFGIFLAATRTWSRPKLIGLWAVAVAACLLLFWHHATSPLNLNF